jgi:PKHD-type hydroxylase
MYQAFQLYSPADAANILGRVQAFEFEDGRLTAGGLAAQKKKNQQAAAGESLRQLREALINDMLKHPGITSFGIPRRFSGPIVNRTPVGGEYGGHVDAARMAAADGMPMRADLSYTLFLSEPTAYEGGSLCFEFAGQAVRVKLNPGQLVLYPSTLIHSVETVTVGERYCVVGWIESMVHDIEARNLLFRLDVLNRAVGEQLDADSDLREEAIAVYQGLLRVLAR